MVDSAFLEATDVFDLQDIFNSDSEKTLQLDEELFFFGHNMTTADDLNVSVLDQSFVTACSVNEIVFLCLSRFQS